MKILVNRNFYRLLSGVVLLFIQADFIIAQTEKEIAAIRAEVAAINLGAAKYSKTTKDVEGVALEGTEATYFRSAEKLRKITAKMYGETYNATGEFYYRDGKLIFAFIKRNQYDAQIGMDEPPKVVRAEERRFYFDGDKLIRLLIGKKELKSSGARYSELKDEINGISSKLTNF